MNSAGSSKKIAIFGAGITGLAAARELIRRGHEVTVYEAAPHIGGLAASFKDSLGFTYDNGPRFIFSTLAEKIGILDECVAVKYYEHMRIGRATYQFPFGFFKNPLFVTSIGLATLTRHLSKKPGTLGAFLRTYYGGYFSGKALAPLIEKWSGLPCEDMSIDFASRLLPTNISYILYSLLKKLRGGITEDYYKKGRYIVYPKESNARIFEALIKTPGMNVQVNSPVDALTLEKNTVTSAKINSRDVTADYFLSTMPVNHLAKIASAHPEMDYLSQLSYRSIMVLFVKLNRPRVLDGLWTWFPEKKYPFYRIAEYKNAVATMAPPDKTLISVEFACQQSDSIWNMTAQDLYRLIQNQLKELYSIRPDEIIELELNRCAHAYPILSKAHEPIHRTMVHKTPLRNLFMAGRTGMFQYRMTEGCYDSALSCVDLLCEDMKGQASEKMFEPVRDKFGRPFIIPE